MLITTSYEPLAENTVMPEPNFRRAALPVAPEKISESVALLQQALRQYRRVTYASSLGVEASVLIDLIFEHAPQIDVFTVDTGRLPEPTLELLERISQHYGRSIRLVFPQAPAVQDFVASHGINGFYRGLEQRLGCCEIRKLEPFKRAIAGYNAWVTGVRHEQSAARAGTKPIEWDERYRLQKISPLLQWTQEEIWAYVRERKLPYNPMHDQGYASIGCAPCTRAVAAGEDSRAGRWWWESPESRECGLQPRKLPDSLSDL
jgi:phosphoadenosine phosphosulfate reductase